MSEPPMASVEIMICLPVDLAAHRVRSEGRRFGQHKAAEAEQAMRFAHAHGLLTQQIADQLYSAIDHDISKTVQDLATQAQVPAAKLALFEKAARRACSRRLKELAEAAQ